MPVIESKHILPLQDLPEETEIPEDDVCILYMCVYVYVYYIYIYICFLNILYAIISSTRDDFFYT